MLKDTITRYRTRAALKKILRLKEKAAALEKEVGIREMPVGHNVFGDIEVHRFPKSGGYNTAAFLKDNPDIDALLKTEQYRKPETVATSIKMVKA